MDYVPEVFQHVAIGEVSETACSPQMDMRFTGLTMAAPEKITLDGAPVAVVPLCAAFQLPASQTINADPMIIHVRRQSDGFTAQAQLGVSQDDPDEPEFPEPDDFPGPLAESLANTLATGWFHVDAQEWLDVDLSDGVFEFFISYAGEVSEKRMVEIEP